MKEIGIRKVNGASVPDIIYLLVSKFTIWILLAFIIITPVIHFFMRSWLENFAFHTNIAWWIYPLVLIFIISLSWLTVGFQTLKASLCNPADILRYE
jgi:putative ABC transport system permease protein